MRKITMITLAVLATPFMAMSGASAQGVPMLPDAPGAQHAPPPGPPGGGDPRRNQPPQAGPERHQPPHAAQNQRRDQSSWRRQGGRMPHGRGYVVNDYRQRHLAPPPRGYHWVRDDNNYMLVAISSGIISSIISATR